MNANHCEERQHANSDIDTRRTPTECEYNINANHCEERSHLIVSAIIMKKKMFDCSMVWLNTSSVHNEETTVIYLFIY